MNYKISKMIWLGVIPTFALILGGVWYQQRQNRDLDYQKTFLLLKSTCQDSSGKKERASAYVNNVCGCFAKTALKHRSISVAGIVGDTDMVHAILQECSRLVTPPNLRSSVR